MNKHLFGGMLLVAGTSIGAGMLALPVVTGEGGFFPSIAIYALCWAFMTSTGLLLLEVCLRLPPDANIVSMAGAYLGRPGKIFSWVLYLFLFYSLSIAYVSGGGSLLFEWLMIRGDWAPLFFAMLFAPFVYFGAKAVDRINWVLMTGLGVAYCVFVFLGLPHIQMSYFHVASWKKSFVGLPVIFTAFSYQGVIPTLATYMKRDAKQLKRAIIGGTTLAFFIYFIWNFLILGIVPVDGNGGLAEANRMGATAVTPLKAHIESPAIQLVGQFFAFFAITTSYLGITLGLMDFLADGLRLAKIGWRRILLVLLTFVPPLFIALSYPGIFLKALGLAGGIGCALLLGFLPILMAWIARKRDQEKALLGGGKIVLTLLFFFVLFELFLDVLL